MNMKAMLLEHIGEISRTAAPLTEVELPLPERRAGELLVRVAACGVCHTELDEIEGRTPPPHLPVIPGHEVIGHVESCDREAGFHPGDRVGVGWIYRSSGQPDENISSEFIATGRDVNGGYAEYMTVPAEYAYPIPEVFGDAEAAPLLCAGGVGYRALRLTGIGDGGILGLTGFGGSAHLVMQIARHLFADLRIFVFARDRVARDFAMELGADWAGETGHRAPRLADAIIDTTPAWLPVVRAMENLKPGGRLVINAIRKEEGDRDALEQLSYHDHLWMEKEIKTVANVTRTDIAAFLRAAADVPIRPEIQTYPLSDANRALQDLKFSPVRGAKVLVM